MDNSLTVFYDGACPICRREIAWYQRQSGASALTWLDISSVSRTDVAPGLSKSEAMQRFHVRSADGQIMSGARAFAELWANLPRLRRIGRILRQPLITPVLELGYRGFLKLRPLLQRLPTSAKCPSPHDYPEWLVRDLRSDHAGETGAVAIYRGILTVSRDADLREFAARHEDTERRHLQIIEELLAPEKRSRLLPIWRSAGFLIGLLPALFGARAVYATVDAVETFVDLHYAEQIDSLSAHPELKHVREQLVDCWKDECRHRDEARARADQNGLMIRAWMASVRWASGGGVSIARRL